MRPPALVVAVAVLCLLAGCNAFAPGTAGDANDGEYHTVTPAEVPQRGPNDIAPGLTTDRLTNATELLQAHRAVLENRSVRVVQKRTTRASNGTVVDGQQIAYRFDANRNRSAIDATGLQTSYQNVSLWSNGTATLYRRGSGEQRWYQVHAGSIGFTPGTVLSQTLHETDSTERRVETDRLGTDDGLAVFRVTIDWGGQSRTDITVDERGFVRRVVEHEPQATVSTGRYGPDATTRRVTTVEADIGRLGQPGWVADARETIADREYVAPGVTTERVIQSSELVMAHRGVVENSSVTYVSERWKNTSNGSVVQHDRTVTRVSADRTAYHRVEQYRDHDVKGRTDTWANETTEYTQNRHVSKTTYERTTRGRYFVQPPDLYSGLSTGEATITRLDDGRYRLVNDEADGLLGERGVIRNPRFVVVFDERGFISRITRTYVDESGQSDIRVTQTTRYTDLGETTVDRPDWLDAAANATA